MCRYDQALQSKCQKPLVLHIDFHQWFDSISIVLLKVTEEMMRTVMLWVALWFDCMLSPFSFICSSSRSHGSVHQSSILHQSTICSGSCLLPDCTVHISSPQHRLRGQLLTMGHYNQAYRSVQVSNGCLTSHTDGSWTKMFAEPFFLQCHRSMWRVVRQTSEFKTIHWLFYFIFSGFPWKTPGVFYVFCVLTWGCVWLPW